MEITKQSINDVTVIAPEGQIDGKTGPLLQAAIKEEIKPEGKILLDFAKVTFMSSAGLRVLLVVHRQAKAQNLKIVLANLSPALMNIMAVTGFLPYFTICSTVDEGVKRLA
jgi:anti-sigma B factor antagonist